MLAFLHTARAHVGTFDGLAREIDDGVPIRHLVREDLLAAAVSAGAITDAVRTDVESGLVALANDGARVIVCTCSTLGSVAETAAVPSEVHVMRIDRPMAEQAVALGSHILVVAALPSTFSSTVELLRETAARAERQIETTEVLCDGAWPLFEAGDLGGYAAAIARTLRSAARPGDVVVLAQASMAPVVELVRDLGVSVLSSPRLGVKAAIARLRSIAADSTRAATGQAPRP
jgi:hypothetical protein